MRTATAVVVFLLAVSPAAAQRREVPREYIIIGTVTKYDQKTFKVTIKRPNGKEVTAQIIRETEVRYDGKKTDWNAIKEKQDVKIIYDIDSKEIRWFGIFDAIDRPSFEGRLEDAPRR